MTNVFNEVITNQRRGKFHQCNQELSQRTRTQLRQGDYVYVISVDGSEIRRENHLGCKKNRRK